MIEIKVSTIEYIVSIILLSCIVLQLLYYLFFYIRICFIQRKPQIANYAPPVSVIICAKNEEYNLRNNLHKVLTQNYPEFEVIVVNDCSEDETDFFITRLLRDYTHLRYTQIFPDPKFKHNKKLAVTIGIKAAKHDYFVFIDADCYPSSENWLRHIAASFSNNKDIVLGYGPYEPKDGFLDAFVRYDTWSIAMQYVTFAHAGFPYMAVGRNMAYTRKAYMQSSRFTKHAHITSGDDDLFIAEAATAKNTAICLHPDSYTYSEQVQSFKEWCIQKRRHISTAPLYSFVNKLLLTLEPLSRILMYALAIVYYVFGLSDFFILISILLALRIILLYVCNISGMYRLQEKKIVVYSLMFDIALPYIIGMLHFRNKLRFKR